ncbi:Sporulation domain protein [Rippkaea orientalis PCC 8801]|uniref:Sporulation domain protein n=1 Tax=Rippkaea orientalis (strain PCC 8801 / RF-1) TaxID=41431 RepID=B7JY21_RIPO1|nr:DUF3747 domain-containing protein [Rippkaea orientalis]ACK65985.1 Sporulation domain protein [Rippkaea orientalis PCC 8801]
MKLTPVYKLAVFTTLTFTSIIPPLPSQAFTFEQQEVNQEEFIAIARPYGDNKYDLLILRQIPGQQQCWSENNSNPVRVEPLLLNFNFTGSCERSTDSNGYSIRIDGQDYGLDYLLRIVERNGELVLIGTHRTDPSQPEMVIGSTNGMENGFLKIDLHPGWKFTRRAYNGKVLSHVYLTGDSQGIKQSTPALETAALRATDGTQPIQEITFTAENNGTEDNFSPRSLSTSSSNKSLSSSPVSPSPQPLPSFSDLPPLAPPASGNSNGVVPPPQLTETSGQSKRSGGVNSVSNGASSDTRGYRVMVAINDSSQKARLRSLYPEAFRTTHNGQSMWQVGLFSSRNNADKAYESLQNAGLRAIILP